MKKFLFICFLSFISCKNEIKSEANERNNDSIIKEVNINSDEKDGHITKSSPDLYELRELNEYLASDLEIKKFGIKKINDSISEFIFILNDDTSPEAVLKYSFGIRVHNSNLETPIKASYSPDLQFDNGDKFIALRKNLKRINYIDSLDVYSYQRKNWKASGRLGNIMIKYLSLE